MPISTPEEEETRKYSCKNNKVFSPWLAYDHKIHLSSCISVSMAIVERLRKIMEKFTRFLKGKGMVRRGQNKSDFQEIEITERAGDEGKQEERGKM